MNAQWRKSTRSGTNGACVEARQIDYLAEVRDSKDPAGPVLVFNSPAWSAFVANLKRNDGV